MAESLVASQIIILPLSFLIHWPKARKAANVFEIREDAVVTRRQKPRSPRDHMAQSPSHPSS